MHLCKWKSRLSKFQWFSWLKIQVCMHAWYSGESQETCTSHYPFSPLHLSPLMSWNLAAHSSNVSPQLASFYTCSCMKIFCFGARDLDCPLFPSSLKLGDRSFNLDWSQNAHETSYSPCFQTELKTVFRLRYSYRLIAKLSECLTVLPLFIFPVFLGKLLLARNQIH